MKAGGRTGFNQRFQTLAPAVDQAFDLPAVLAVSVGLGWTNLSPDQQDKVRSALYQYALSQGTTSPNNEAIAQARASGNLADVMNLQIQAQKQELEDKLKVLADILTSDQLKTYQQKQLDMIEMQTDAMRMFLPQATNAPAQ